MPADWAIIGNMPIAKRDVHGKLATTTFERSPRMPSYLVELTAGQLRELSATDGKLRFGVWAVAGEESEIPEAEAEAYLAARTKGNTAGPRAGLRGQTSAGSPHGIE